MTDIAGNIAKDITQNQQLSDVYSECSNVLATLMRKHDSRIALRLGTNILANTLKADIEDIHSSQAQPGFEAYFNRCANFIHAETKGAVTHEMTRAIINLHLSALDF